MNKTNIEWTDATWNPVRGCTRVSEGCRNCYAEAVSARFSGPGQPYEGLATRAPARWTGKVRCLPEKLQVPLQWTKPRRIFVNSMSDLFHEDVPFEFIDRVFAVMALCPRHTFQQLTKRPERAAEYHASNPIYRVSALQPSDLEARLNWPLPNVWLGVSVENQQAADERIPLLLDTPAAIRFLSVEPLLGPVDLSDLIIDDGGPGELHFDSLTCDVCPDDDQYNGATIDWVIVGGESGPHARPMHPDWVRDIRDQCAEADVPFFFKQWGEWINPSEHPDDITKDKPVFIPDGWIDVTVHKVGKKLAGSLLDGREHNAFPKTV